mmetsp:Transcript_27780/g.60740  ORF Transcript_27780/g.60740 Transcript_27780/m.60740 type:complete len:739 (-) Transcript_27780:435-2651(-)|eukprot:CAMPEP_0118934308 /NCGR_PEP_ID=MMETSP1169-20130426/13752_1 /TAXON_ID=36882 /ORGANISM="Pyramimonas obovata, Strain CCMP722" /LENGTH=738 /DNA_ID=CAMNT_0006877197 /DNA_START=71 /DNA_END=2287 /DNA_ORIENTATION=+
MASTTVSPAVARSGFLGRTQVSGSKASVAQGLPVATARSKGVQHVNTKISAVATPSKPPVSFKAKRSAVEIIKEESDFLRHPLMEELTTTAPNISEPAMQLMKFHGSYMQDEREKRAFGKGKSYQFMMRTRQPAGVVSNELYKAMDDMADQYGNGTLRLTTRQTYQLHGILKGDLKTVFSTVIKNMGSTLGACGDVNRNVCGPPAPYKNKPEYIVAEKMANDIADLLAPQSGAYYDVWLDGDKFMSSVKENPEVTKARADNSFGTNFENSPEPIYGHQFLPRKFKIAVTVPGDNSVDLFTNDLGVVVLCNDAGELLGANLLVGGGMGRAHRNKDTAPYLAVDLGFVPKDDIFYAIKAVVATQRDYGRRDDRKQARLKYLVHRWGIDKFRSVCEQYYGKKFETPKPLPPWKLLQYHGWIEQGDGKLAYGVPILNGRLKGPLRTALRTIIERYELPVRLTANQDIILTEIDPAWKQDVESTLRAAGIQDVSEMDPIVANSMSCPAMPLCGLAIGEAERASPMIMERLRAVMDTLGLAKDDSMVVRMTGCPNGCARPYMAELGFVCDGPNSYQLWIGACPNQTRISEVFVEKMKIKDLEKTVEPLLAMYKAQRSAGEAFGDFVHRVGFDALRKYSETYTPGVAAAAAPADFFSSAAPAAVPDFFSTPAATAAASHGMSNGAAKAPAPAAPAAPTPLAGSNIGRLPRVMIDEEAFAMLLSLAEQEGKTLTQMASDAIKNYKK